MEKPNAIREPTQEDIGPDKELVPIFSSYASRIFIVLLISGFILIFLAIAGSVIKSTQLGYTSKAILAGSLLGITVVIAGLVYLASIVLKAPSVVVRDKMTSRQYLQSALLHLLGAFLFTFNFATSAGRYFVNGDSQYLTGVLLVIYSPALFFLGIRDLVKAKKARKKEPR